MDSRDTERKKPASKIGKRLKAAANSESVGAVDRWSAAFAALDEFPRDFELIRDKEQKRPGLDDLFADLKK